MRAPYCFLLTAAASIFSLGNISKAEEAKLLDLSHDPADNPRRMPLNLSSPLTGGHIESSDPSLTNDKLLNLVDPNRASGVELTKGKEYNFTLTFDNLEQINKMTLAGELKGSTVDLKMSKIPSSPTESPVWQDVIKNQKLDSDINSLNFKPQPGYQASLTLKTDGYTGNTPPTIRDISTFGNKDIRAYTLVSKSEAASANAQAFAPPGTPLIKGGMGTPNNMKLNVGSISAGASIVSTTLPVDARQIDNAIDDNVATFLEVPKNSREGALVVDLGQSRTVDHVSVTHSKTRGVLKAFLVGTVPGNAKTKLGMRRFIVIMLRGELILTRKDKTTLAARKGDLILPTETLRTGRDGYCELKCEDSSVIRMGPNTSFQYLPKDRTVTVSEGSVLVSTAPGVDDIIVKTPSHNIKTCGGNCVLVSDVSSSNCRVTNLPSTSNRPVEVTEQVGKSRNPAPPAFVPVASEAVVSLSDNPPAPSVAVSASNSEAGKSGGSKDAGLSKAAAPAQDPRVQPISVQSVVKNSPFFDSNIFAPLASGREKPIQTAMHEELLGIPPSGSIATGDGTSMKERVAKGGVGPNGGSLPPLSNGRGMGLEEIPGVPLQEPKYLGMIELDKTEFSEIEVPTNLNGRFVVFFYVPDLDLPQDLADYDISFKIYDINVFGLCTTEDFELAMAPPDRVKYLTASLQELDNPTEAKKAEDVSVVDKAMDEAKREAYDSGAVDKAPDLLVPETPEDASPTH